MYGIDGGKLQQVAVHNAKFFGGNAATNPNFLTNDEESSGIIDAKYPWGRMLPSAGAEPPPIK